MTLELGIIFITKGKMRREDGGKIYKSFLKIWLSIKSIVLMKIWGWERGF